MRDDVSGEDVEGIRWVVGESVRGMYVALETHARTQKIIFRHYDSCWMQIRAHMHLEVSQEQINLFQPQQQITTTTCHNIHSPFQQNLQDSSLEKVAHESRIFQEPLDADAV